MELEILFKLFWKKLSYTIEEACGGNVNQLRSYINSPSSCIPSESCQQITRPYQTVTSGRTFTLISRAEDKDSPWQL